MFFANVVLRSYYDVIKARISICINKITAETRTEMPCFSGFCSDEIFIAVVYRN